MGNKKNLSIQDMIAKVMMMILKGPLSIMRLTFIKLSKFSVLCVKSSQK